MRSSTSVRSSVEVATVSLATGSPSLASVHGAPSRFVNAP
jgi:hypothetical protein